MSPAEALLQHAEKALWKPCYDEYLAESNGGGLQTNLMLPAEALLRRAKGLWKPCYDDLLVVEAQHRASGPGPWYVREVAPSLGGWNCLGCKRYFTERGPRQ